MLSFLKDLRVALRKLGGLFVWLIHDCGNSLVKNSSVSLQAPLQIHLEKWIFPAESRALMGGQGLCFRDWEVWSSCHLDGDKKRDFPFGAQRRNQDDGEVCPLS